MIRIENVSNQPKFFQRADRENGPNGTGDVVIRTVALPVGISEIKDEDYAWLLKEPAFAEDLRRTRPSFRAPGSGLPTA